MYGTTQWHTYILPSLLPATKGGSLVLMYGHTRRALTELRELWLNMHALSGSIPPSFGGLTKLTRLHLSFNRFSGARAEPSALYVFLSRAWLI